MYVIPNFKTKKQLKEAVKNGEKVRIFEPGLGEVPRNGNTCVEGPHSPKPHTWYAGVTVENGIITGVR